MQEEVDPRSLPDLLENALDPILVTIGNTLVMANAPALVLTGYDRDEILRLSLVDLIHPDERNRIPSLYRDGEPGLPAPGAFHTVLVCQDGSLRPVEISVLKTTWSGRPAAFLVLRDTSRRTEEIAHLREVEQNLRFLIENTIDGILVASEEGRYLYANRRICELTGYAAEELLEMPYTRIIHPDEIPKVRERFTARISGRPAQKQYETIALRRDGLTVPVELTAAATTWRGKLADVIIVRDITPQKRNQARLLEERETSERLRREVEERRRVEAALRVSEERFRDVADASGEYIFELDSAARITYVSERVATVLGYSPEELIGRTPYEFNVPDRDARTAQDLVASEVSMHGVRTMEQHAVRRDGNYVWLQVHIMALRDEAGAIRGYRGTALDITEQKRASAALQRRDAILEAVSFAAERLLATERLEDGIDVVLERLGIAAEVGRASLYVNHSDEEGVPRTSRQFSWRRPGAADPGDALFRNIPVSIFPQVWVETLRRGAPVRFAADEAPEPLGRLLQKMHASSILALPVRVDDSLWGFIGLSTSAAEPEWQDPEIEALRLAGNVIGAVLKRQAVETSIRRRDAVLEAVSFAAERLFKSSDWERDIPVALERIARATGMTRAAIHEHRNLPGGGVVADQRYIWADPNARCFDRPAILQDVAVGSIMPAEWLGHAGSGTPLALRWQDSSAIARHFLRQADARSLLIVPIHVEGSLWGVLGLSQQDDEISWQPQELEALQVAGNVLGAVLHRLATAEALHRRDQVLEAVSYAAERLLTATEWDRDIPAVLERLAIAAGANQASLYTNEGDRDGTLRTSRRFVWTAPGTPRVGTPPEFQNVPVAAFFSPADMEALHAGQSVVLHPEPSAPARGGTWEIWATVLTLPILVGGKLWGGLGLDSLSTTISWQHPVREALQAAANLIGAAVQRVAVADALRRKDRILEAVSFAAEELLGLPPWQQEIEQVLERLGRAADIDRVVIQEIRQDAHGEERLHWLHGWASEEFPPLVPGGPPEGIPIVASGYASVLQSLRQGQAQVIPAPDAPPEIKDVVQRFGVVSVLSLPVHVHGRLWGVIGFSECRSERAWSAPEVDALRTSAEILGVAMERQEGDAALRASEERYRSLVEGTDQAVALIERSGVFRFANARALADFGGESIIGRTMWEIFPQAIADRQMRSIRDALDRGELLVTQNPTSIRGEPRWFESRLLPTRDASGRFDAVQLIATDITERKIAEERILSYQARLRSLTSELALTEQRERRRIAADLHDRIGQFLAITKIKLAQLRAEAASPELRKPLDEIWDLVDQSIQDTRSLTFELSPPVLYELGLEPALDWLVETMNSRHVLAATFHDDGRSKPLGQDLRGLLFQAVQELLLNAAKHAAARKVAVTVRRDGDEICCEVVDDGCGFDPADVFTAMLGGANPPGFGLFSIRERLEHLGGRLELDSAVGRGTRATLRVPLRPETESTGSPDGGDGAKP